MNKVDWGKVAEAVGLTLKPWQIKALENSDSTVWIAISGRNQGMKIVRIIRFLVIFKHSYELPKKDFLVEANKCFAINYFETMVELHDRLNNAGIKVRELKNIEEYRREVGKC